MRISVDRLYAKVGEIVGRKVDEGVFLSARALTSAGLLVVVFFCFAKMVTVPEAIAASATIEPAAVALVVEDLVPMAAQSSPPDVAPVVAAPAVDPWVPKVVIDPGHGGRDGGTVKGAQAEKVWTLEISKRVAKELKARGHEVLLTRDDDEGLRLTERSAIANKNDNLLFVSIHLNASLHPEAHGIETFYSWPRPRRVQDAVREQFGAQEGGLFEDQRSEMLAAKIQHSLLATTSGKNRHVKNRPNLAVTRNTICPAVLVECGFLSNPGESALIAKPSYRQRIARGIANGIISYLSEAEGDPKFGVLMDSAPVASEGSGFVD